MLRRIASVFAMMSAVILVAAGTASAAPIYAPASVSVVSINVDEIIITGTNFGTVDGPDDVVTVTVSYGGPSGLRSSAGLSAAAAAAADGFSVTPDENGNWSKRFVLTSDGDVIVTAVGNRSGAVPPAVLPDPPGVPTAAGGGSGTVGGSGSGSGTGSSSGSGSGSGNSGSAYSGTSGYSTGGNVSSGYAGLASTGASIGAPLAIGIVALLAGLTLLFFGTRGVLRRKSVKSGSAS